MVRKKEQSAKSIQGHFKRNRSMKAVDAAVTLSRAGTPSTTPRRGVSRGGTSSTNSRNSKTTPGAARTSTRSKPLEPAPDKELLEVTDAAGGGETGPTHPVAQPEPFEGRLTEADLQKESPTQSI